MATFGILIAIVLALLLLRLVYSRACLKKVNVMLSISGTTATEGDVLTLTEVVTNEKWLPLPWLAVKFQVDRELEFADLTAAVVSDLYYRNDLFHILMHQKITRRLKFTCSRRGYYAIRGLEVTGWDILMEKKYIRHFKCDARLTVYPATLEMEETEELCTRVYGHLRTHYPIHPDPFSFRGIREYSSNDPMKSINFKASAKAQELMVNVWDFANARQVVLLLDVERYIALHNEALDERAIKIVASLAERFSSQGVHVSFITNGKSCRTEEEAAVPKDGSPSPKASGEHGTGSQSDAIRIPEGRGNHHLRAIMEALAYIDISASRIRPFADILDEITQEGKLEPEYWLISPYYSKNVDAAFSRLKTSGARTAWIMPEPQPRDSDFADMIIFV